MNKKALPLAVGAALIATAMMPVQADPTVYGRFHLSWDRQDNDNGEEQSVLSSNSSRFGIKGEQALEGGLKGIYQMETAFITDEGGGTLAGRNTFLGVSHALGTAKFGRHDTPYKELGYRTNRFIEQVGDARNVMGAGSPAITDGRVGFDSRPDNMLRYDSPTFAGIQVSALYSGNNAAAPGTGVADPDTGNVGQTWTSARVQWQGGPAFAGVAVEQHGNTTTTTEDERGIRVVGDYAFGPFTVGLFLEMLTDLAGVAGADADVKGVAGAFKFGENTVKLHLFDRSNTDGVSPDDGSKMISLGFDHALSKTATAYVTFSTVDNDPGAARTTAAAYTGHGDVVATVAGKSPKGVSVGVMVAF